MTKERVKEQLTELIAILDMSGSMYELKRIRSAVSMQ